MHEAQMHEKSCFITLTYNEKSVPNNYGLKTSDFQNFMKKLRKAHAKRWRKENEGKKMQPEDGLRFFHCGEYTDDDRPHYHACLFGEDFMDDRIFWQNNKQGQPVDLSARLEKTWGHGFVTVGALEYESARYVARYILKKLTGPEARKYEWVDAETGECHDRKPPYVTMSRRPGLGSRWIQKYVDDVYPSDEVIVKGKKRKTPKYYDKHLEGIRPKQLAEVKKNRKEKAQHHTENNTPDRLRTRDEINISRAKINKGNL